MQPLRLPVFQAAWHLPSCWTQEEDPCQTCHQACSQSCQPSCTTSHDLPRSPQPICPLKKGCFRIPTKPHPTQIQDLISPQSGGYCCLRETAGDTPSPAKRLVTSHGSLWLCSPGGVRIPSRTARY